MRQACIAVMASVGARLQQLVVPPPSGAACEDDARASAAALHQVLEELRPLCSDSPSPNHAAAPAAPSLQQRAGAAAFLLCKAVAERVRTCGAPEGGEERWMVGVAYVCGRLPAAVWEHWCGCLTQ